ncbi:g3830 [Coccomyxa viridis]|uniref:tRNA pseudouridine synthase n=1 Tax=Coccomyxa viridis TaxID=1274662 RepID=A0ABP1FSR1_9CHLO
MLEAASAPAARSYEQIQQSLQILLEEYRHSDSSCAHELAGKLRTIAQQLEGQREAPSSQGAPPCTEAALDSHNALASLERSWASSPPENAATDSRHAVRTKKKDRGDRAFAMNAYQKRYVALEIFYLGAAYHGFASQADTELTAENQLYEALRRTKLIPEEAGWQELGYSRCGRTDKGVSALSQVVALNVRSLARHGQAPLQPRDEMDYAVTLNRALPDDVRVLGWAPLPDQAFSARFSARGREYKYYIVQHGELDIEAMQEAATHFVGDHDFRNFCKVDAQHVSNFRRTVLDFRITPALQCEQLASCRVYALHVRGTAFLWHQVRCMAAVLLMVGRGLEQPSVVQRMLDIETTRQKPQYNMAAEEPLLFYRCAFDGLEWQRSLYSHVATKSLLQGFLDAHLCSASHLVAAMERLEEHASAGLSGTAAKKSTKHVPLLKRATEPALEERLLRFRPAAGMHGGQSSAACEPVRASPVAVLSTPMHDV